jgi:hypothetical protein
MRWRAAKRPRAHVSMHGARTEHRRVSDSMELAPAERHRVYLSMYDTPHERRLITF